MTVEKTIKAVIHKKIDNWIESIQDEKLQKAVKKDVVVAGGCITSLMLNDTPKDYDVYFKTKQTTIDVARYYTRLFNQVADTEAHVITENDVYVDGSATLTQEEINEQRQAIIHPGQVKIFVKSRGVLELPKDDELIPGEEKVQKYVPIFLSSNAITLSGGVQAVIRFYGEPAEIHDTYDFVHTKAYWTYSELSIPKDVYEMVYNKTLIYTGSRYPLCSLIRMRKFINRGWSINAGQILKIALNLSQFDLMNPKVLEDQLVGMDSLFFASVIHKLQVQKLENPSWELTPPYIMSIVDKVFSGDSEPSDV